MLLKLILLSLYVKADIEILQRIERLNKNSLIEYEIFNCGKAIGKKYFDQPQNVEIISKNHDNLEDENFGIVIRNTPNEFKSNDFRKSLTKYAFIFLESINYQDDLKTLKILSQFDPQGRFIVSIIMNEINIKNFIELEYVKLIIRYLANIEKWNVVILLTDTLKMTIKMYTYTMYSYKNCTRIPQLIDRGNCGDEKNLKYLFPRFVNFHKCPIRLASIEFPPFSMMYKKNGNKHIRGVESNIVKLIIEKLNATYKVFQVSNGTNLRRLVKIRKADLAWSCLLQYTEIETTWSQSYIINKVLIIIPQSRLMPPWMNLILPFQIQIWATLGTFICVYLVITILVPPLRRQFHLEWMLSGFFGIGIRKLPTRLSHQLYFLSWIFFGYIIMQSYVASLSGFFTSPGQYKQMQTLDELDKSKIVTAGLKNMKSQLAQTNPRIARDLKIISETEYFENLAKLASGRGGIASFIRQDQIQNITRGKESEFIVIPEYVNFYPIALLLPNSSSILEACNRIINQVSQSGLIKLWFQEFTREMNSGSKFHTENTNQKSSLEILGVVFFLLCIGYCLSSIVFAGELILAKNVRNK